MADTATIPAAGPGTRAPVAEAIGVSKRFGATVALRDARVSIAPGESHALVGRNGAGKSTLVSILTGLQEPDTGSLRFSGAPAPAFGDVGTWRSRGACVYQRSTVIGELTVAENLFLNRQRPGAVQPIRWKQLRGRAEELLGEYGVAVDIATRAKDLTVEQRQFVEIARSLSFGARFIILDEPTAKLDARGIGRGQGAPAACRPGDPALPPGRSGDRRPERIPHPQAAAQRLHRHPGRADHAARPPGRLLRGPVHREPAALVHLPGQCLLARHARRHLDLRSAVRGGRQCTGLAAARSGALRDRRQRGGGTHRRPRVDRIVWIVLILGSLLAAFAGILYSGHYGSISATQGSRWIFQVFAATDIGGVSLNGGKGSVFGALTGVLTLQLVVNVMTLAGVPPLWNQFLNGAIIIVALIISRFASGEKQE